MQQSSVNNQKKMKDLRCQHVLDRMQNTAFSIEKYKQYILIVPAVRMAPQKLPEHIHLSTCRCQQNRCDIDCPLTLRSAMGVNSTDRVAFGTVSANMCRVLYFRHVFDGVHGRTKCVFNDAF